MDFDPKTTKLHSQEEVEEYLENYGVELSPGIKVEFCPLETKFGLSHRGVYMHPQVLALGLKLSIMKFVRSILTFYIIAPSQLSGVAWRTVLGFQTLCLLKVLEACQQEVFSAAYALKKLARMFATRYPKVSVINLLST